jgi:integrase
MQDAIDRYSVFLGTHRGLSLRTLARRAWQLARFGQCLESQGVTSAATIAPAHLQRFFCEIRQQAVATRLTYAVTLRGFLGWAYGSALLPTDLRRAVLAPRQFRQATIRDVLSNSEVTRILEAVDRRSAIGRRDYAVLLLAARYGLRPSEIRNLKLEELHWRQRVLSMQQSKTGRLLVLPLLPDVVAALTAYLRDGRPATGAREVFVRHRAPFEPFVAGNNLATIMRGALRRIGLGQRSGRRGLYLFRHTLASRMLASGCGLKTIGDVLGHASLETTMEYASIDLTALRRVALSEAEVKS